MEQSAPSKLWFLPLLSGILFIIAGIWIFRTPESSYVALSILFAAAFFVSGIFEIFRALGNTNQKSWIWGLVFGLVDLIFGVWLLSSPVLSAQVLSLYVGFIVLFRSISSIGFAMDLKDLNGSSWGITLLFGIIGTFLGMLILFNPILGGITVIVYTSLAFIFVGFFQIALAFSLKKLK